MGIYCNKGGVKMANIAYVRVSTIEQNEERQIAAFEKFNIDKWFIEKVSAKDTNRPELNAMLNYIREGDKVYIHDFSRLARNTADLLQLVEQFTSMGITLVSNKENIDTATPTGKLMLTMIGAIAEFERANLLERQREGIAIAKAKGVYKGRQVKKIDNDTFEKAYQKYKARELNKTELAKELNISRPKLYSILKEKGLY